MSAFRILATAKPTLRFGPVQPMDRHDEAFWRHRERAAAEARQRREARRAAQ